MQQNMSVQVCIEGNKNTTAYLSATKPDDIMGFTAES